MNETNTFIVDGGCYTFVDQVKNPNDAKSYCESRHGFLFEPRSAHTNELVYFKGKDVLSGERMWIGVVTQNGKSGPWKFATTGDDVIQPLWKSGQPNDASNQEIWAYLGCGVKEWCDAGPTNMYRFICEYNIFDVSAIKVRTYFRIFLHKFEKMSNWSLQLMSIIKSGYLIIKKFFLM